MLIFMFVFIHQGHNLGHSHSGKGGVTYADPTCNMGNQGASAALVLAVTLLLFYFVFHSFCFAYIPFHLAFAFASFLVQVHGQTQARHSASIQPRLGTMVGIQATMLKWILHLLHIMASSLALTQ